jgi:hypothetical protein
MVWRGVAYGYFGGVMNDETQDIEFAMLHPIDRDITDLQSFGKFNYFERKKFSHKKTNNRRVNKCQPTAMGRITKSSIGV